MNCRHPQTAGIRYLSANSATRLVGRLGCTITASGRDLSITSKAASSSSALWIIIGSITVPRVSKTLSAINDNYLNVQQDILETFIDRGQLRLLAEPTITPTGKRIPGLRLDHPRQLALMHALVRFAHIAAGNTFTTAELHPV